MSTTNAPANSLKAYVEAALPIYMLVTAYEMVNARTPGTIQSARIDYLKKELMKRYRDTKAKDKPSVQSIAQVLTQTTATVFGTAKAESSTGLALSCAYMMIFLGEEERLYHFGGFSHRTALQMIQESQEFGDWDKPEAGYKNGLLLYRSVQAQGFYTEITLT